MSKKSYEQLERENKNLLEAMKFISELSIEDDIEGAETIFEKYAFLFGAAKGVAFGVLNGVLWA